MSAAQYAKTINRTPRCVQNWCSSGLIGRRVGGRWEIDEGTPPPVIEAKRKVGRLRRSVRLKHFKRKSEPVGKPLNVGIDKMPVVPANHLD
jgi:hypothetical protein